MNLIKVVFLGGVFQLWCEGQRSEGVIGVQIGKPFCNLCFGAIQNSDHLNVIKNQDNKLDLCVIVTEITCRLWAGKYLPFKRFLKSRVQDGGRAAAGTTVDQRSATNGRPLETNGRSLGERGLQYFIQTVTGGWKLRSRARTQQHGSSTSVHPPYSSFSSSPSLSLSSFCTEKLSPKADTYLHLGSPLTTGRRRRRYGSSAVSVSESLQKKKK